ncbi:MAG: hypothetical protein FWF79_00115 [Defluviitaleaceae bacterium]|nr:hypothetical protein [Defluviitaleaceae bacterium]
MKTGATMDDIRKIRDENSLKYLSQSSEERERERQKSLEWFIEAIGKPVEIVGKLRVIYRYDTRINQRQILFISDINSRGDIYK